MSVFEDLLYITPLRSSMIERTDNEDGHRPGSLFNHRCLHFYNAASWLDMTILFKTCFVHLPTLLVSLLTCKQGGTSSWKIASLTLVLTIICVLYGRCPDRRPDTTFSAPCTNNVQCQNVNLCIAYSNLFIRYV